MIAISFDMVNRHDMVIDHGRAIAYVAREVGIPAVICLSELVPEVKRLRIGRAPVMWVDPDLPPERAQPENR